MQRSHGTPPRGLNAVPQAPSYDGRFGRMFRSLATFKQPDELLERLAARMHEDTASSPDNPEIPAGYTYLGHYGQMAYTTPSMGGSSASASRWTPGAGRP